MDPPQEHHAEDHTTTTTSTPPIVTDNTALHVIMQSLQQLLQQQASQGNQSRGSDELDGIKLVPPDVYHGERTAQAVEGWLHAFDNYCRLKNDRMLETTKVRFASTLLRGEASEWWRQIQNDPDTYEPSTWYDFCVAFREEFKPNNSEQLAREALDRISQQTEGSIRAYVASFRKHMLELPSMDPADAIYRFIQGLNDDARMQVLLQDLVTLRDAYNAAERFESAANIARGMRVDTPHAQRATIAGGTYREQGDPMDLDAVYGMQQGGARIPRGGSWRQPFRNSGRSNMGFNSRGRGRGGGPRRNHNANIVCWHCGTMGHVERNCPTRNHAINSFIQQLDASARSSRRQPQPQLHSMDTQDEFQVALDKAQFESATRSVESYHTNDVNRDSTSPSYSCAVDVPNDDEIQREEVIQDMTWEQDRTFLARQLTCASTTVSGLPLHRGYIHGHPVSILIDSGASANYMSPRLQSKADQVVPIMERNVETANGAQTAISKRAHITLDLGGYIENNLPVYIFDSKFDIILGQSWLQKVCPQPHWPSDRWFPLHEGK